MDKMYRIDRMAVCALWAMLALLGCSSTQQPIATNANTNDLLPQKVVIKYEHNLAVAEDAEKIKSIDYLPFVQELTGKMKSGSVTAYDPVDMSKEFSKSDLDYLLAPRMDTLLDIDEKTFDTIPVVKEYRFDPTEVQRLVMSEDWHFNAEKFSMDKKIIAYAPIKVTEKEVSPNSFDMQKHMLFWVKGDGDGSGKKLLASGVTYEFDLYNMNTPSWLESLSVSRFVNILLNSVLEGKVKAYDFFADEKVALSADIVRENLGATVENYFVEDENEQVVDTVQVVGNIYPDEIRSLIFVEDWYVDDAMNLYKVVKRIAPVRHYYMLNDLAEDEVVKKVPFIVDLNYQ